MQAPRYGPSNLVLVILSGDSPAMARAKPTDPRHRKRSTTQLTNCASFLLRFNDSSLVAKVPIDCTFGNAVWFSLS
jgi:hypothetical protein